MEELRDLNNRKLYGIINKSKEEFEEWLIKLKLLPGKQRKCECGGMMNKRNRGAKGLTYRCTKKNCRKERGARNDTFFSHSNLTYDQIFELSYLWANDQASVKNVKRNLKRVDGPGIADKTITDWKNLFRDMCQDYFNQNPIIIGGEGIVVHIDETVITKRKYDRGRVPSTEWWFFGGIEVETGKAFMVPVKRRDRATLIPLIQKHIAPGSVIHSDCWPSYSRISRLPERYTHRRVNHSENFVDPATGVHTQNIESLWQKFKSRHKREYGTRRTLMFAYMVQFLWFREFGDDPFYHFWSQVQQKYNFSE